LSVSETPWQVEELKAEITVAVENIDKEIPFAVIENSPLFFCQWCWMHKSYKLYIFVRE
jgi:hypothetical protein